MFYRSFREQVRSIAAAKGVLLKDVAFRLQRTPTKFSFLITKNNVGTEEIEEVAQALEVSPWVFDRYVAAKAEQMVETNPSVLLLMRSLGEKPQGKIAKAILKTLKEYA